MSHVERVAHVLSSAPDSPLPFLGSALLLLGRIANSDGRGCCAATIDIVRAQRP